MYKSACKSAYVYIGMNAYMCVYIFSSIGIYITVQKAPNMIFIPYPALEDVTHSYVTYSYVCDLFTCDLFAYDLFICDLAVCGS